MLIGIEKATRTDLEIISSIEQECFSLEAFSKERILSLLEAPNAVSLLAYSESEIVGFIIALIYQRRSKKVGHVVTVDVARKARRKGVGTKLLEELEWILRSKHVESCYLEVGVDNESARELYRKTGYFQMDFLKDFYGRGGDAVRLVKLL